MPTYSTTAWPDVIGQTYQRGSVYRSMVTHADIPGADQAADLTGTQQLWAYQLGWDVLAQADAQSILHAAETMGGGVAGLYFFEWPSLAHSSVYVGLGDGTANPITLPVKGAASATMTRNGVSLAGTFSPGTGANGEDRFVPSANVTAGQTLRASFTGRRRRKVRLTDNSPQSFQLSVRPKTAPLLWIATVNLIEMEASET